MTHLSRIDPAPGRISLVGAGPGAADLLTLRALRCLQTADVVLHDRLVPQEILDLIPQSTRRVNVGKAVGQNAWPQDRITALMLAQALMGAHVVRLKSGDPAIFARAAEEIAAARDHGIPIEMVPGITAASAAAASLGRPLTTRGVAQRLVLATATDEADALTDQALPLGTTLALYMGGRKMAAIEKTLLAQGTDPATEVAVVCHASRACEHIHLGPLAGISAALAADPHVSQPCVILLTAGKLHGGSAPGAKGQLAAIGR